LPARPQRGQRLHALAQRAQARLAGLIAASPGLDARRHQHALRFAKREHSHLVAVLLVHAAAPGHVHHRRTIPPALDLA
jgi:hypothetical protein